MDEEGVEMDLRSSMLGWSYRLISIYRLCIIGTVLLLFEKVLKTVFLEKMQNVLLSYKFLFSFYEFRNLYLKVEKVLIISILILVLVCFVIFIVTFLGAKNEKLNFIAISNLFDSHRQISNVIGYFQLDCDQEINVRGKNYNKALESIVIDKRTREINVYLKNPTNFECRHDIELILPDIRNYISNENSCYIFSGFETIGNKYFKLTGKFKN